MSDFPYPGLRPFRRDETDIFFGREGQVDQLLERLEETRFLAVVGPSGCGKSSLVQAGLFAALETGFLASAGVRWRTAKTRPGTCPMRNLARALVKESALGPERGANDESAAFLLATLRRGPLGLIEALSMTPLPEGTNLLILADQFEEIFRYRKQYSLDEAEAFVALLLASAQQKALPIYAVITMRSDFLGDCAFFSGLPEAIDEGQFLTPRLTREQCRAAIVGPAEVFGGDVEPALVNQLLNDMGADSEQLPLFQHALMRMWRETGKKAAGSAVSPAAASPTVAGPANPVLTLDDYKAIGGLGSALSNHADEAFDELDDKQKFIAEVLFRCLCERSESQRDTRRPRRLSEIAVVAEVKPEQVAAVVDVFRRPDRSFLTPPGGTPLKPETIIDISHESLISLWKRLNTWVAEEADSADTYCRLEQTARLWKGGKAELWAKLDLANALAWQDRQHPNREWAKRYGSDFDLAMQFLDESKKKQEEEKRRAEEAHYRELRQAKKRLALALGGLIIALGLLVLALWESRYALKAAERAKNAQNHALQLEKQRTRDLFESYLTYATLLAKIEDYKAAHEILKKCRELDSGIPLGRRHVSNILAWFVNLMGGEAEQVYEAGIPLLRVKTSLDGHLLAAVGFKGTVVLFDADSGKLLKRWQGHKDVYVEGVAFHPSGKWLVTAGRDHHIMFWALPSGEKVREWRVRDDVCCLAFSPDGRLMASGGFNHNVTIWDFETGEIRKILKGHDGVIYDMAFSPRGNILASASWDNTARIWDLKADKLLHVLYGHTDDVDRVAFHPNGKILATCGDDKTIRLWNIESGKPIKILQGHKQGIYGLTFVGPGRYLASGSLDYTLWVWDTNLGIAVRVLQGHRGGLTGISSIGSHIFSAGMDGTLRRWHIHPEGIPGGMRVVELPGKPSSCAIAPDGSSVAVGFADGVLRLYALPDVRLLWEKVKIHTAMIRRLAFRPDGQRLVCASEDNTASLWQVSGGKLEQIFRGHSKGVYCIAFSPDGRRVATAGLDGRIGLFEPGREEGRFYSAHEGAAYSVAFDAGGQRLVSTGEDGRTRLWSVKTWAPALLRDFPRSSVAVFWAEFSPDDSRIARVGNDSNLSILRTVDGSVEQVLPGHEFIIYRAAFSPDGRQAATVSPYATVHLWDLEAGAELFTLRLPSKFDPGGVAASLQDFDFRCVPSPSGKICWIAVPLTQGILVLYNLGQIYD